MKKKLTKKLTLNKETIAVLCVDHMEKLKGGTRCSDYTLCDKTCESLLIGCCSPIFPPE